MVHGEHGYLGQRVRRPVALALLRDTGNATTLNPDSGERRVWELRLSLKLAFRKDARVNNVHL